MRTFRKSSLCSGEVATDCAEVKIDATEVVMRNSKMPGKEIFFTQAEWQAFVAGVKNGEFDA